MKVAQTLDFNDVLLSDSSKFLCNNVLPCPRYVDLKSVAKLRCTCSSNRKASDSPAGHVVDINKTMINTYGNESDIERVEG